FVIGRLVGPASLGVYNVALELSTLPTTELVMPINRAVFPGYAKLAHDPDALRRGFLAVTSLVASLAVPAAVGVAVVAEPLVMTLLGPKWRAAIPIIQILALYGLLRALQVLAMDLFVAAGRPAMQLRLSALNLAILVPSLVVGATSTGLAGAAWGALFTSLVMLPITYASLTVVLRQAHREYWRLFWRPALAAGVMFVAVGVWSEWFGSHSLARFDGLRLVTSVLIGAFAYGIALVGLWIAAGRPHGAESRVVGALRARVRVVVRA
ncbi:MAG: oligosaccharide flippase family protein, partial [Vicinamibacteria bacterium]|nr:oligosaccharide flippase family protein [Vicinamibacteria bacterium]